nr:helix-turn-helix domain-containing protein [Embleya hyalina]
MARRQPDAPGRLAAALDLFEEHGYENTTVIEVAEHAGPTKSTFFRHFPDKREVPFGTGTMTDLLVEGIASAPPAAGRSTRWRTLSTRSAERSSPPTAASSAADARPCRTPIRNCANAQP